MTKTDTNVPELVINTLTNAEYEAAKQAGEISSTELYMTTDDPDYVTSDQLAAKQDTLVSGTNIKTINNQSILGNGNLELSTYLPYPSTWHTTSSYTTAQFCGEVAADTSAVVGKAYLGEVNFSDLPQSLANGEVVVEIMGGTTSANKVIVLSLSSGTTAPYIWKYIYWNGGSNISGWVASATINDNSTNSTVETWSAYKLNNETSLLASKNDIIVKVSTLPTATADLVNSTYFQTSDNRFYQVDQTPATYRIDFASNSKVSFTGTQENLTSFYSAVTRYTIWSAPLGVMSYDATEQKWEVDVLDRTGQYIFGRGYFSTAELINYGFVVDEPINDGYETTFTAVIVSYNYIWNAITTQPGIDPDGMYDKSIAGGLELYTSDSSKTPTLNFEDWDTGYSATFELEKDGDFWLKNNDLLISTPSGQNLAQAVNVDYLNNQIATMQTTANLVTSLSAQSTDTQYPSAKCVYEILGNLETALYNFNSRTE